MADVSGGILPFNTPTWQQMWQQRKNEAFPGYGVAPAPIGPQWENMPTSTNIDDRRSQMLTSLLLYALKTYTGATPAEWAGRFRNFFTPQPQPSYVPPQTDDPLST